MIPNPAVTNVAVKYNAPTGAKTKVSLTTIDGKAVIVKDLGVQKSGVVDISLEKLPAGVYLVTLTSGNNKSTQTLVKD